MTRELRLTRRAEESLTQIAIWTIKTFGARQANKYENELLSRCRDILEGRAHSRSCAALVKTAEDLRYVRAGEHFLVYTETPEAVIIIDVLHGRCDLHGQIVALATATYADDK